MNDVLLSVYRFLVSREIFASDIFVSHRQKPNCNKPNNLYELYPLAQTRGVDSTPSNFLSPYKEEEKHPTKIQFVLSYCHVMFEQKLMDFDNKIFLFRFNSINMSLMRMGSAKIMQLHMAQCYAYKVRIQQNFTIITPKIIASHINAL